MLFHSEFRYGSLFHNIIPISGDDIILDLHDLIPSIEKLLKSYSNKQPKPNPIPGEGESAIQRKLYLNRTTHIPKCVRLLLWERPIFQDFSHFGVCDLIFLTIDGKIQVIETKFLDFSSSGKNQTRKRRKKRRKVEKQVIQRIKKISELFSIPITMFVATIATNDPNFKVYAPNVNHIYISI